MPRARSLVSSLFFLALVACSHPGGAPQGKAASLPDPGPGLWDAPEVLLDLARAEDAPEQADREIVLERRLVRLGEDGRAERILHRIVRYLTPAGVDGESRVEADFSPWYQARPEIRARVVRADGTVRVLDPATLSDSPVPGDNDVFTDRRRLEAPLPGLEPGAVAETVVTLRDTAPMFAAGQVHRVFLRRRDPIRELLVEVEAPAALPLKWAVAGTDLTPEEAVGDGQRRVLRLHARDLEPVDGPPPELSAEVDAWLPHLTFGSAGSWRSVAEAYGALVDERIAASGALEGVPDVRGLERVEAAGRLLAWVRSRVRYTGLDLGDGAIVPRPPSEVLSGGFGDCKDQATLLVALLRQAGLPAHVALLTSGFVLETHPEVPGLGAFDHAIVHVPGSTPLWIDPVATQARAGELPLQDQARRALVAAPGTEGLVTTPAFPDFYAETRVVELAETGRGRVVEVTRAGGTLEQQMRGGLPDADAELRTWAEDYVRRAYGSPLEDVAITPSTDLARPFELRVVAPEAELALTQDEDASTVVPGHAVVSWLPRLLRPASKDELTGRREDLVLARSIRVELTYEVHPPAGFVSLDLPEPGRRELGGAWVAREVEASDGRAVRVRFVAGLPAGPLPVDRARRFHEAVSELLQEDGLAVTFQHQGARELARGRVREALGLYRELAHAEKAHPVHARRYASKLLDLGFTEAARGEAETAVAKAPDDPENLQTLAWILQHDAVGRLRGAGYERAAAIDAYRRTLALDPERWLAAADLAILLEHDAEGERYRDLADMKAAADLYASLWDREEVAGLRTNYLVLLLRMGKAEELRRRAEAMPSEEKRDVLLLVATALLDGPEAAGREAARRYPALELRRGRLQAAAATLFTTRYYPQAAGLFEQAARTGNGGLELVSTASVLRRTRRWEEVLPGLRGPSAPLVGLTVAEATGGAEGTPKPRELMSKALLEFIGEPSEEALAYTRRALRTALASSGLEPEVGLDLALATAELRVDGTAETGWRVRWTVGGSEGTREVAAFVVLEDGRHVLRSTMTRGGPGPRNLDMGREALARLDRNEPEGARSALEWGWDQMAYRLGDFQQAVTRFAPAREDGVDRMRLSAAVLTALATPAHIDVERELALIEAARDVESDPDTAAALDQALVAAFSTRKQWERTLAPARRLATHHPDAIEPVRFQADPLARLGRWDEALRVVEAWNAAHRDRPDGYELLGRLFDTEGRHAQQLAWMKEALARNGTSVEVLNGAAWYTLYVDGAQQEGVDLAERSCRLSAFNYWPALHTLGAVYAEAGRPQDARQAVLKTVEVAGRITTEDWYTMGRIAEAYGLEDAAVAAYRRVPKPEDPVAAATSWTLAQRRLEALRAVPR